MRAAMLLKYDTAQDRDERGFHPIAEDRPVTFHGWGMDYEEFEQGAASYSVAIIEYSDGTVSTVVPSLIRFLPPLAKGE